MKAVFKAQAKVYMHSRLSLLLVRNGNYHPGFMTPFLSFNNCDAI